MNLQRVQHTLAIAILIGMSAPAFAADAASTLERMAEIEARIEALESRQQDQSGALEGADQSLKQADALLGAGAAASREGEQWLQDKSLQSIEAADRLRAERLSARQELETARLAARRSGAALALKPAGHDAAEQLGLLLLERRNRTRAALAGRKVLQLAAAADQADESQALTQRTQRQYNAFSDLSLSALKDRHAALAEELRALQDTAERRDEEIARLRGQRDELKKLVAKLAEEEAAKLETEAAATPAPEDDIANPEQDVPADPATDPDTTQSAVGPDSTTVPVAADSVAADPINTQVDGVRRLFWHAAPVGVRILAGGRVAFAGPYAGYRHLLIMDHGGGWRTLYGNMTQCTVKVGQTLTAGARVGEYRAGQGNRAEPLWFEVRRGAEPVEPSTWPAIGADWERHLFYLPQAAK